VPSVILRREGRQSAETLDEIALRHGTDKASTGHGFTAIYEPLVVSLRESSVALLEIGVFHGASLRTWADYFPNGKIVGVDNQPLALAHESARISVEIGDQADFDFMRAVADEHGPFDLVIDDGSHFPAHQRASLDALWPALKAGGFYIVEDIHTSYFGRWSGGYRKPGTLVEYVKEVVDDVNQYWHDEEPRLRGLGALHVYTDLCVFVKEIGPFRHGVRPSADVLEAMNQPLLSDET
jgi:Methyltransferase domain